MRQDEGDGVDIDKIDAGRELEVEECKVFAVTLEEVEGEGRGHRLEVYSGHKDRSGWW